MPTISYYLSAYVVDRCSKSSRSSADGACVEMAHLGGGAVAIRDSKNLGFPALGFAAEERTSFSSGRP
jgi:hypothetical protein